MKLFLASEAKHPASIGKMNQFVGGFHNKKIAYIVTAGNGEGWGSWKDSKTIKTVEKLGAKIKIIQLEDYWNIDIIPTLEKFDIIWFVGGYAGYLMYWIKRINLENNIRKLLNKNIFYIGSSAGSMVASKSLDVAEWYIDEPERGAGIFSGMDLVDFDIYPHYDEKDLEKIKNLYTGKKMYLLKNGEQIIVDGDKIIVDGETRLIENE